MLNSLQIDDIDITIHAEIGTNFVNIGRLLQVGRGGIIPLLQSEKSPIKLVAGNVVIAHGDLEIQDGRYVIRISEVKYKVALDQV